MVDVLVVGMGLSGALVAEYLARRGGVTFMCLESRDRVGGRLLSHEGEPRVSLGGAWLWPSANVRAMALARRLGVPHRQQLGGSGGEVRLQGGAAALVHRLVDVVGKERVRLGARVRSLEEGGVVLESGEMVAARRVVLCVPPREMLRLVPALSHSPLARQPTWMASMSKALFVYERPFWRAEGLPGRVSRGPIVQLYDSSDFEESCFCLCAFVPYFSPDEGQIHRAVAAHLRAIFPQAPEPSRVIMYHWWRDVSTVGENVDPATLDFSHPAPMPNFPVALGENLFLAGTELAQSPNCGLIEGAIESAERVIEVLRL